MPRSHPLDPGLWVSLYSTWRKLTVAPSPTCVKPNHPVAACFWGNVGWSEFLLPICQTDLPLIFTSETMSERGRRHKQIAMGCARLMSKVNGRYPGTAGASVPRFFIPRNFQRCGEAARSCEVPLACRASIRSGEPFDLDAAVFVQGLKIAVEGDNACSVFQRDDCDQCIHRADRRSSTRAGTDY